MFYFVFVRMTVYAMIRCKNLTMFFFIICRNLPDTRVTSPFMLRMLYDDRIAYNIVETASEVLGKGISYKNRICFSLNYTLNSYVIYG